MVGGARGWSSESLGGYKFFGKVLVWQLELSCYTEPGSLELITCELQGPYWAAKAASAQSQASWGFAL